MTTRVEDLQRRVRRAQTSVSRPLVGTARTLSDIPIRPQMSDAEYAALVARKGKQAWTPEDEEALGAKVRRIRG